MKKEDLVVLCTVLFVIVIALVILYKRKESYDPTDSTLKQCMASCDAYSFNRSKREACIDDCSIDDTYKNCVRVYGHVPNCERILSDSYIDLCKLYPENCNQYF
jgi:hypothetical protein